MSDKLILTAGPSITEKELAYVADAVQNGWNENWNAYILRLEEAFRAHHNMAKAIATSSCTGAMHIALMTMGIGPGDEVIVPDVTWISTASVVRYVGATPVFCDVAETSWCMDPVKLEALVTPRTRAIMPVHLYGHPADMPAIMKVARKHGLMVLEDAAPALGAEVAGHRVGSFGDFAAYSFQGAKLVVGGEGGVLLIRDATQHANARQLNRMGLSEDKALWSERIGYKYHMSNMQAALVLAQFERLEELVERKRAIHARYARNFDGCDHIRLSGELPGCRAIHWMPSVEVLGCVAARRLELIAEMKRRNVDSRPVFYPISSMPMFERAENPVAYRIGHAAINLPSGHSLTDDQIDYVSETVMTVCYA